MISSFFLCFFIIPVILAHHKGPLLQKQGPRGAHNRRFWRMPASHPLWKELERDPGIPIGKADDSTIAQIRRGDFSSLGKNRKTQSKIRNPAEIFFRKERSSEQPQCIIEVQMVMSHLGRCIKLADNTPACQNDQYVSINSKECN